MNNGISNNNNENVSFRSQAIQGEIITLQRELASSWEDNNMRRNKYKRVVKLKTLHRLIRGGGSFENREEHAKAAFQCGVYGTLLHVMMWVEEESKVMMEEEATGGMQDDAETIVSLCMKMLSHIVPPSPFKIPSDFACGPALDYCRNAMERYADGIEVRYNGLDLIRSFSEYLACQNCHMLSVFTEFVEKGGLAFLITIMKNEKAEQDVQCQVVLVLSDMASRFADEIVEAGGIEAVTVAMNTHVDDRLIQDYGCHILATLSSKATTFADEVVVAGGIEMAMAAMNNKVHDRDIQVSGCCLFSALSHANAEYARKIKDAGGLQAVAAAREKHKDDWEVMECWDEASKAITDKQD